MMRPSTKVKKTCATKTRSERVMKNNGKLTMTYHIHHHCEASTEE